MYSEFNGYVTLFDDIWDVQKSTKINMKKMNKQLILTLLLLLVSHAMFAGTLKGTIKDKATQEGLIGATIRLVETSRGTVTDLDGNFCLENLSEGNYTLEVKYIGYRSILQTQRIVQNKTVELHFLLETDSHTLDDVVITARANTETRSALLAERKMATKAIEGIGNREMTLKGISNVSEGVKKITGVSIADAGQLVVRGLGDRYSTTTLNGLPIASPNPDNKLIPLDLFPASIVKNIIVTKVYDATTFADYSGAHIDISTRETGDSDFFNLSFGMGVNQFTIGKSFYKSDRQGTLFKTPTLHSALLNTDTPQQLMQKQDYFGTGFSIKGRNALPDFNGSMAFGKNWTIGAQKLSMLASAKIGSTHRRIDNAYAIVLRAQGTEKSKFDYSSYTSDLNIAALASLSYTLRQQDRISYTLFYARNAEDKYMQREGFDMDNRGLIGSNSVFHAYTLLNNQLFGHHRINNHWEADWGISLGITGADEPDRRQVMFQRHENGKITLFKLNKQETMRYFGELNEKEGSANLNTTYRWGDHNRWEIGGTYRDKSRDFSSPRFYYNLNSIDPEITNIYDTDHYLNQENISNGLITIQRDNKSFYAYRADHRILSLYTKAEFYPHSKIMFSLGVRYERSEQGVDYFNDASAPQRAQLDSDDFFPALNIKYDLIDNHTLRFAASRTVTRPSFVEMSPFKYQESFGGTLLRGNADLQNGYNYNFDVRYECFRGTRGDHFSLTGYYKILQNPIERIQQYAGATPEHSFRNADNGMAAGIECELRQTLYRDLALGVNCSYMYTNIVLPEGDGAYTDSRRALQGASPYLLNADLSYTPQFENNQSLAVSIAYNLQGPRIHAIGLNGLGNVEQQPVHLLDLNINYRFNEHISCKAGVKDLLQTTERYIQQIADTQKSVTVQELTRGSTYEIGFSYNF